MLLSPGSSGSKSGWIEDAEVLRGRLLDDRGATIAGATVSFFDGSELISMSTAIDGRFERGGFVVGKRYVISLGRPHRLKAPEEVVFRELPREPLELVCYAELGQLEGRVVTQEGIGIAGASVRGGCGSFTATSADGRFRLPRYAGDKSDSIDNLEVRARGFLVWKSSGGVAWGATELLVRMDRGVLLTIRLTEPSPEDRPDRVKMLIAPRGKPRRLVDWNPLLFPLARMEVSALQEGVHDFVMSGDSDDPRKSWVLIREGVELKRGALNYLDLAIPRVGSLQVSVDDGAGSAVSGANVEVFRISPLGRPLGGVQAWWEQQQEILTGLPVAQGSTDVKGGASLRVFNEDLVVRVSHADFAPRIARVPPGSSPSVEVSLLGLQPVTGHIPEDLLAAARSIPAHRFSIGFTPMHGQAAAGDAERIEVPIDKTGRYEARLWPGADYSVEFLWTERLGTATLRKIARMGVFEYRGGGDATVSLPREGWEFSIVRCPIFVRGQLMREHAVRALPAAQDRKRPIACDLEVSSPGGTKRVKLRSTNKQGTWVAILDSGGWTISIPGTESGVLPLRVPDGGRVVSLSLEFR